MTNIKGTYIELYNSEKGEYERLYNLLFLPKVI